MRLTAPKTPAPGGGVEPAVRYDFLSSDEFRGMGGSLFPAAAPPVVNNGLVLDGATQYATLENNRLTPVFLAGVRDEISVYVEFAPTFNWDAVGNRGLYDSNADGTRCYLFKMANPGNELYANIGQTLCVDVAPASYSALWRQNQQNRVVIAAKSASTAIYLNGVAVVNASAAAAFTRRLPSGVYIGCGVGGGSFFAGTIFDWCLWPRKLTSAEALEITRV